MAAKGHLPLVYTTGRAAVERRPVAAFHLRPQLEPAGSTGAGVMKGFARTGAWLLLGGMLGGCGMSSILESGPGERGQAFPASYKPELLAFFRNYLNDPVAVREAVMAEPALRSVGGRVRGRVRGQRP